MTPKVPSPNDLLGFFKVWGFLLGFAPCPMDVGTQAYLEHEVGIPTCLEARLGPELALVGFLLGLLVPPLSRFPSKSELAWGGELAPGYTT